MVLFTQTTLCNPKRLNANLKQLPTQGFIVLIKAATRGYVCLGVQCLAVMNSIREGEQCQEVAWLHVWLNTAFGLDVIVAVSGPRLRRYSSKTFGADRDPTCLLDVSFH